jgi:hypothetical protein
MLTWNKRMWQIWASALFVAPLALGASASADEIYSWQTEDGTYAFTDDPQAIPARYRGQIKTRQATGLENYERHTSQVPGTNERYAAELERRLEYLRKLNAEPEPSRRARGANDPGVISVRLGGEDSPSVQVAPDASKGPLVIESRFTKPSGSMVTRESTIVSQDGRTLLVTHPRSKQSDVNDFQDESELH